MADNLSIWISVFFLLEYVKGKEFLKEGMCKNEIQNC